MAAKLPGGGNHNDSPDVINKIDIKESHVTAKNDTRGNNEPQWHSHCGSLGLTEFQSSLPHSAGHGGVRSLSLDDAFI